MSVQVCCSIVSGPHAGQSVNLATGQRVTVGRMPTSDFCFPNDPELSSNHFSLLVEDGSCVLNDLQSTNGTFYRGRQENQVFLQDGDEFRAGQTVFSVSIKQASTEPLLSNTIAPNLDNGSLSASPTSTTSHIPPTSPNLTSHTGDANTPIQPNGPAVFELSIRPPDQSGQSVELPEGISLVIGRTAAASLQISTDPELSSLHLEISVVGGECFARDLSSSNGTFVNETRVSKLSISPGDVVRAGRTLLSIAVPASIASPQSNSTGLPSDAPQINTPLKPNQPITTTDPIVATPMARPAATRQPDDEPFVTPTTETTPLLDLPAATIDSTSANDELKKSAGLANANSFDSSQAPADQPVPTSTSIPNNSAPPTPANPNDSELSDQPNSIAPSESESTSPPPADPPTAESDVGYVKVSFQTNDGQTRTFRVAEGHGKSVGSGPSADQSIVDDATLEGRHFELIADSGVCILRHLATSSPTFVNGEESTGQILSDGDKIVAGSTAFTVTIDT